MLHRRAHRFVNIVISLCLFGFVVIFLKGPSTEQIFSETPSFPSFNVGNLKDFESELVNDSLQLSQYDHGEIDLTGWAFQPKNTNFTLSGRDIVNSINFLNENFNILNVDKFGPVENVKTVIVIQVHNRATYLRYLIESLRDTKGIEDTLLIFSHDINTSMNEMIRNISFARVYQIFYPFNMQIFPHVFPGQDPRDCPEKLGKEKAVLLKCRNSGYPDKYGNFRVAKLTQIKHHWWWKMNYVFDGIIDRFGLSDAWVLLLEEDHYVTPDALHVLNIITERKKRLCEYCEIISLGFYLKTTTKYGIDIDKLGAHPWYSSKHNMGMALQRDSWQKIKNCSEISAKCLPQRFRVIFAKSPRVLHIGDCGVHTHRLNYCFVRSLLLFICLLAISYFRCNAHNAYASAKELLSRHKNTLFPTDFSVTDVSRRSLKPSKENGGWGDARDRELCRINTHPLRDASNEIVLQDLMTSSVYINNSHRISNGL
uniref:Alpha-1,6-mannosyl-glycoprotein 2-beta-N-acetylglucosaminyltransferase n=1 Tax=Heterorhabditis bacteriophora TaxID=37862 RepID=A0A1I7WN49_HETBA